MQDTLLHRVLKPGKEAAPAPWTRFAGAQERWPSG